MYVGDHPENDVLGARNAGMHAIWKKDVFGGQNFTDEHAVDDLKELLSSIDRFQKV